MKDKLYAATEEKMKPLVLLKRWGALLLMRLRFKNKLKQADINL